MCWDKEDIIWIIKQLIYLTRGLSHCDFTISLSDVCVQSDLRRGSWDPVQPQPASRSHPESFRRSHILPSHSRPSQLASVHTELAVKIRTNCIPPSHLTWYIQQAPVRMNPRIPSNCWSNYSFGPHWLLPRMACGKTVQQRTPRSETKDVERLRHFNIRWIKEPQSVVLLSIKTDSGLPAWREDWVHVLYNNCCSSKQVAQFCGPVGHNYKM